MKKEDIVNVVEKIEYIEFENSIFKKVNFIDNSKMSFNKKGKLQSIGNKPAVLINNNHVNFKAYLNKNILHRDDFKPAITEYETKKYFINGKEISKKKNKKLKKQSIIRNKILEF